MHHSLPPRRKTFRYAVGNTARIALLLLIPKTSLKESLSHLSVVLRGTRVLPDGPTAQPTDNEGFSKVMSALSISIGLMIVLFAILLFYRTHRPKAHIAMFGSQRMCPACGLITSRLKAYCLECGKLLPAVV